MSKAFILYIQDHEPEFGSTNNHMAWLDTSNSTLKVGNDEGWDELFNLLPSGGVTGRFSNIQRIDVREGVVMNVVEGKEEIIERQ